MLGKCRVVENYVYRVVDRSVFGGGGGGGDDVCGESFGWYELCAELLLYVLSALDSCQHLGLGVFFMMSEIVVICVSV